MMAKKPTAYEYISGSKKSGDFSPSYSLSLSEARNNTLAYLMKEGGMSSGEAENAYQTLSKTTTGYALTDFTNSPRDIMSTAADAFGQGFWDRGIQSNKITTEQKFAYNIAVASKKLVEQRKSTAYTPMTTEQVTAQVAAELAKLGTTNSAVDSVVSVNNKANNEADEYRQLSLRGIMRAFQDLPYRDVTPVTALNDNGLKGK